MCNSTVSSACLLTFSCCPVYGASGAQSLNMSTRQHAVHALTPLSLCPRRFGLASSFAILRKESRSFSSCSMLFISFDKVWSLRKRSAMAMGFPTRHDRGSLNCRPGNSCCGSSNSMVVVVVENGALVSVSDLGALYSCLSFPSLLSHIEVC